MSDKIIYSCVHLTEASKAKLLEAIPARHPNVFAEHMTIKFRPDEAPENLGETVALTVVGLASDDRGQAVVVKGAESSNAVAHITVSCADGTKPFYSNELLERGYVKCPSLELEGVVSYFNGKGFVCNS